MKKPVLLLVDDDRAVLDALESELAPAFTDLCRIEAFEDPRAVLDAVALWTEQRRSIALAIVDQKMPGMAGTELLATLREHVAASEPQAFSPTRHMRSILLTGYAGLDSAMEAKNLGGVDRYLEKPWNPRTLQHLVRRLIRTHHVQAGTASYWLFRELEDANELRQQFRLRYEVYSRAPDLACLLSRNKSRLAVDAYDLVSNFLGLFLVQVDDSMQIGGVRVIGEESPAARTVIAIVQEDDLLRAHVAKPRAFAVELPLKWPDPDAIVRFIDERVANHERIAEIGRLVLTATERGSGLGRSPAALAILEGVAAWTGFVRGIENTVLNCSARHAVAYSAFGFRHLPGTAPAYSEFQRETIVALRTRPEWVPEPARSRVLSIVAGTRRNGGACRCRNFPACTGGPYETGDFTGSDLLCPRLVLERTRRATTPDSGTGPTGAELDL